jgi:DNA-binding MarR family transcriptional regulator
VPNADIGLDFLVAAARLTRLASRHVTTMPHATMRLLGRLDELGPTRISDLAKADRCSQPTMSVLVQRLQDSGWVRRDPDPADSRASLISLTPSGSRELDAARQQAAAAIDARLRALSAEDLRRLADAIPVMRDLLTIQEETAS